MDFSENRSGYHHNLFLFRDIFSQEGDEAPVPLGQFS